MKSLSCGTVARSISALAAAGFVAGCQHGSEGLEYLIDDGEAEAAISIDPGEDTVWLNAFPVQSGGEVVHSVSVSFGRPGVAQPLDGLPIKILLYEEPAGGSPLNAVLKQSVAATTANANTGALTVYEIPPTEVHGTFLVGVLFRNGPGGSKSISALDRSAPTLSDRSYYGFAVGLDETNLSTIPAGQFGTIESLGQVGNWLLRAGGNPPAAGR